MIDLVLAGDNAVVIGLAAARLPKELRNKAILVGIIVATILRVHLASLTTQLLEIVGLLLAGGILLLWVCWKMWRELRVGHAERELEAEGALEDRNLDQDGLIAEHAPRKTFGQADWQIVIADVSMSLDNVLAVAGAARASDRHGLRPWPVDRPHGHCIQLHRPLTAETPLERLCGLAAILYVVIEMVYRGAVEVWPAVAGF
jgi:YjbE family integral membrane protein